MIVYAGANLGGDAFRETKWSGNRGLRRTVPSRSREDVAE